MVDPVLAFRGIQYATDPEVYDASDDTFLLLEAVLQRPPGRLLELGTGAGLVAVAAARAGHRVTATDVNPAALRLARANAQKNNVRLTLLRADLARGLRLDRFDLIAFNPPYLPTERHERLPGRLNAAFDGGPSGQTLTARLMRGLPANAPPTLVVGSSLQGAAALAAQARAAGLRLRVLDEKRFDAETIFVYELTPAARAPPAAAGQRRVN